MNREELNQVYKGLDTKARNIIALCISLHKGMSCTCGYYNGHYHRNAEGTYEMDYFPIPVITVEGLCDIELDLDRITVSTKLKRDAALGYNYEKLNDYKFEAFGVEEYLDDFYLEGYSYNDLVKNIEACAEQEIGFAFEVPFAVNGAEILEFVQFLKREGFYY